MESDNFQNFQRNATQFSGRDVSETQIKTR